MRGAWPSSTFRIAAWTAAVLAGVTLGALALGAHARAVTADLGREPDRHQIAYVGSAACGACHAGHAASWHRTFHRTMTEEVGPRRRDPVAGDFADAIYRYDGVTARMHRDAGGRYVMSFTGPPGQPPVDAIVVRSIGSRRYQQYLAEAGGALWRLPLAYHVEERRWFPMNGAFLTPDPDLGLDGGEGGSGGARVAAADPTRPRFGGGAFDRHVTRWNDNCVFCHNVAPNPGREATTGRFSTTVAELGIACEACHGPGTAHVRANGDPVRRYLLRQSGAADPTIVNPSRLSPARAADLCGRCHGQRLADDIAPFLTHGDPFVPGDALALYSSPLWRDTAMGADRTAFAARFWDDGTPRLTAYEYQGLLESGCAERGGLTCTSCHGMHDGDPRGQIRPSALGDRACTTCHDALAATAKVAAHTRHDPAGPGARCVACHMPRVVYGVLDVHVSHRIEIPDPARAVAFGRPDACTLCHVDADRAWAVRARARLWPRQAPGDRAGAADHDHAVAETTPVPESGDHLAPRDALFAGDPIARAVAAFALGAAPLVSSPSPSAAQVTRDPSRDLSPGAGRVGLLLASMAGDRYPAVRHLAARSLARILAAAEPQAATLARAFDPTADAPARARALAALREALIRRTSDDSDAEQAPPRLARLRAEARRVDIDIGE